MGDRDRPAGLTIAGSDSCGGAGIQADLKTMLALDVHGTSALTAVTAQSTGGVRMSATLAPEMVASQIDAVLEDVRPASTKTGMLASSAVMEAVAERVASHALENLVVDPVMVATSGSLLIEEDAVATMRDTIVPMATLVTPNIPELETLTGLTVVTEKDIERAAARLLGSGARNVLVKGGHRDGPAVDILHTERGAVRYASERIGVGTLHGTGCTASAAVVSYLARGFDLEDAVGRAKRFVTEAIRGAFAVGGGGSLLDHAGAGRTARRSEGREPA
ncbi:MAG: bifunctional hydroxymethylpyrimidine kinase/phosphomethylpyrimidine kinase [Candidatus Eisenbacteria bacterium]|nr:bifunctional hydroxymethylpyrimidine kinase/phosphomethylpyrimidine kinase [Candidatus Eisenbacteria bacterium]